MGKSEEERAKLKKVKLTKPCEQESQVNFSKIFEPIQRNIVRADVFTDPTLMTKIIWTVLKLKTF